MNAQYQNIFETHRHRHGHIQKIHVLPNALHRIVIFLSITSENSPKLMFPLNFCWQVKIFISICKGLWTCIGISQSSSHKSEVIHYWNAQIEGSVSLWIGVRIALHFSDTIWKNAFIFLTFSKYHLSHFLFHSNAN